MKYLESSLIKKLVRYFLAVSLVGVGSAYAEDDVWHKDVEFYGWLPEIKNETVDGTTVTITPNTIIKNLDIAAMGAGRLRKGRWSVSTDIVYFKISDDANSPLLLPGGLSLGDVSLESVLFTPNVGYMVVDDDQKRIELYAGARYFWIDVGLEFELELPGQPPVDADDSISEHHWDAIAGVRGLYYLNDKWYLGYSVNAGAGDSDFTWTAQTAIAYKFEKVDALVGWRYMDYDLGSDVLDSITINGPFAGVMYRW